MVALQMLEQGPRDGLERRVVEGRAGRAMTMRTRQPSAALANCRAGSVVEQASGRTRPRARKKEEKRLALAGRLHQLPGEGEKARIVGADRDFDRLAAFGREPRPEVCLAPLGIAAENSPRKAPRP